jgi:hypothetical protein
MVAMEMTQPSIHEVINRRDAIVISALAINGISRRLGTHIGFL